MLMLTRKPGQSLQITAGGVGPHTPIGEVFASGPIEISVAGITNKQVRVGIAAHPGLTILRSELATASTRPNNPLHHSTASDATRRQLAQKLTVLRIIHKLTRQQLADLSHCPLSVIIAMEGGTQAHTRITLDHLDAVAHTFGIPVSYLFVPPESTPEERILLAMLLVTDE